MARVVQRADVGMIQAGDGFRFAFKTPARLSKAGEMSGQDLYRDDSIQARITGFVNLAHPTSSDSGEDFVGP